jgi:hypothetical protein
MKKTIKTKLKFTTDTIKTLSTSEVKDVVGGNVGGNIVSKVADSCSR